MDCDIELTLVAWPKTHHSLHIQVNAEAPQQVTGTIKKRPVDKSPFRVV